MKGRIFFAAALVLALMLTLVPAQTAMADPGGGGFDEFGYNRTARIFNGTAMQWCMGKVGNQAWCDSYLGPYANDKLLMKWNSEWDRGNAEAWANPPYDAWENNEWNGSFPGGSGGVWHYKIVWVGDCSTAPVGSGCPLWGQFATIMSQGTDRNSDPVHMWEYLAQPNGYGFYP